MGLLDWATQEAEDYGIISAPPAVDGTAAAVSDAQAYAFNQQLDYDDQQSAQQLDQQMKQQWQQAENTPPDPNADGSGTAADQLYAGDYKPWQGHPYYTQ